MVMVNDLMRSLAKNLFIFISRLINEIFELTVTDKNAEYGGLDAEKKSAISPFRATTINIRQTN
jgi:hypothetical protein